MGALHPLPSWIRQIFEEVKNAWREELIVDRAALSLCGEVSAPRCALDIEYRSTQVHFPAFSGTVVNMLPFVMGHKSTLPSELQQYWPLVTACPVSASEYGKVIFHSKMHCTVDRITVDRSA